MTINKPIRPLVDKSAEGILNINFYKKDEHKKTTMALLKKLLTDRGMNQAQLAKELHRDETTINRWSNDSREINWENAVKIAGVLKCHPVNVFQPKEEFILKKYLDSDFFVKTLEKDNQHNIRVPFEWYHKHINGVQVYIPGTFIHREVFLFNMPKIKVFFSQNVMNRLCFIKFNNKKEMVGILKTNMDGNLTLMNPLTRKSIQKQFESFSATTVAIAVPIIAKYDPDTLISNDY